jgi:hypothetical protein
MEPIRGSDRSPSFDFFAKSGTGPGNDAGYLGATIVCLISNILLWFCRKPVALEPKRGLSMGLNFDIFAKSGTGPGNGTGNSRATITCLP